jgi:hypothetical protein
LRPVSHKVPAVVSGQILVVGNDEKMIFDDRGQPVFLPPGKDNVTFLDMSNRDMPVIIGTLPLPNSLFGPPTNVAVTPNQCLALISNAVNWVSPFWRASCCLSVGEHDIERDGVDQPLRGKRVLVVEDRSLIATLLADMLGLHGHTVDTVANGAMAPQRLRERTYDLIVRSTDARP